jgi:hypothetical protein
MVKKQKKTTARFMIHKRATIEPRPAFYAKSWSRSTISAQVTGEPQSPFFPSLA